ncbi:MAG: GNAT family N-acetyltransferase [Anaerolineae bacterium]
MTAVVIRTAQPSDAANLITYIKEFLSEPNLHLPLTSAEFTITITEEQQLLAEFAAADNSVALLAEVDSQIVGELNLKGGKRQATRHTALLGISVRQGWRGRGVGSALLAQAIEWARGSGVITRLELYVYVRNEAAIHLYQKFGFEIEGRRRRVIYQHGEYLDDLVMALLL